MIRRSEDRTNNGRKRCCNYNWESTDRAGAIHHTCSYGYILSSTYIDWSRCAMSMYRRWVSPLEMLVCLFLNWCEKSYEACIVRTIHALYTVPQVVDRLHSSTLVRHLSLLGVETVMELEESCLLLLMNGSYATRNKLYKKRCHPSTYRQTTYPPWLDVRTERSHGQ